MKPFTVKASNKLVVLIGIAFSVLNLAFIVTENFWGLLLPFGLALMAAIVLALDKVLLFLVFSTPLSIAYLDPKLNVGFNLPTEPILFGVLLLFIFKVLYEGSFDRKVVRHPLSLAILFNLFWLTVTSVTSELPLVSFKYLLARIWFVVVYFYLMSQLFKRYKNIKLFFWLFMIPLAGVVLYTIYIHSGEGFSHQASTWVMFPFFKEHTSYGAVLAMYIPMAFLFSFFLKHGLNNRFLAFFILAILLVGVILSFTRAAWVSLVAAAVVGLLVVLKVQLRHLVVMTILGGITLYLAWPALEARFEQNKTVSSDDLGEHVESISNVSSDASNMERINRWKSAFRMFEERPLLGFGPGTYMFLYAPFQKPQDRTIISTNSGDLGNAHSEYIGPLAESGVLGSLSIMVIVLLSVITGIKVYHRLDDPDLKLIALGALLGLITYWTHGFLNNFLEMDKAACPVWGFSAILVILSVHPVKKIKES